MTNVTNPDYVTLSKFMCAEDSRSSIGQQDGEQVSLACPFCQYGALQPGKVATYLICDTWRRRVCEVCLSAPRLRMLLEAFNELESRFYGDKEIALNVAYVRSAVQTELEARGYVWLDHRDEPERQRVPDAVISGTLLSATALRALNDMRQEYEFDKGGGFVQSVLEVLGDLQKRTPDQARLWRQLRSMTPAMRESLTKAIESQ